jgi:ABC-type nitrate/sulfonate/bicarbonate transport system substrate-binding protein
MKKGLGLLAVTAFMVAGGLVSCGGNTNTELKTVKVGLQGNFGASAGFVGIEEGYFEDEGIKAEKQVLTGPNIIAGLKAGTVDIGFLGNGVSWNYFVPENTPIKMLTIDNLSNDDRLIVNKNSTHAGVKSITTSSSLTDLYTALKGSTLAADLTATPGSFLNSMLDKVNEGIAADKQIWYKNLDAKYPTTATSSADYQITIQNVANSSITATMTGADAPDFCIAFAPISATLLLDTAKFGEGFTTAINMPEKLTPSTWAVSTAFLKDNKDTVQKFMNGLVKSLDYRSENVNGAAADTANQLRVDISTIITGVAYWPSAKDLQGYFSTADGQGMKYVEQIRSSQLANTNLKDVTPLASSAVIDTTYLLNACEKVIAAK